ncbi:nucleotidyltransferase [Halobiforma lacisalsi AJ5]|uniref:Nucleotidyltransferase n=2 Tax=Natronobacterium lacisalsi TaxID=229731 RepID=M0LG56_NATLA|nr:nucleotidyltransferase domain-containing protein [Halobiforma lacisalsi]APW96664.1 nucleotidyltransferase [Halobiforma lacisalsi AJ5]EMA32053.1 Nucleotidyltransferase [Halobiforma lacisalsi AJ5]
MAVDEALEDLVKRREVAVPLAVARGSHAWDGAGPDSDYDVGFVFVPTDLRRYAHLEGPEETIVAERDEIELQGLEVRRFAELLADSNESALALCRSPIRYRDAFDPADLRAYLERTYNPIDLYHDWRSIAASNYRKYLSEHLVRDGETYPIEEVRGPEDGPTTYVVRDGDEQRTISADDDRYAETATRPTVKRNLTICRAAMYARYLRATGECAEDDHDHDHDHDPDHDLPALSFETFLREQAPAVFDPERIERARALLERKRAGDGDAKVGDRVGREFAYPPREIDPNVHVRPGPEPARLDAFVDGMIDAARARRGDGRGR